LPGLPVDTHVTRLTRRLGLTRESDPVKIELELNELIPGPDRGAFSLRLIEHGRRVCDARSPRCAECDLAGICPSAGDVARPKEKSKATKSAGKPKTTKAATKSTVAKARA
jgi:endonuclease III